MCTFQQILFLKDMTIFWSKIEIKNIFFDKNKCSNYLYSLYWTYQCVVESF